ncbi:MAG: hypothetical protein IJ683_08230 [Butyrivibrio sp.]|nr:hypothetical protein [Butyrivibrio sp.]MBR1642292.1 hypothetical protein [Butyrivibrio sp.]
MSGKNNATPLIGIGIAALMLVSSIGGYKFITAVNPKGDDAFNKTLEDTLGIELKKEDKENTGDDNGDVPVVADPDTEIVVSDGPDSYQSIVANGPYTYKSQNTRTYSGPAIYTAGTFIFNSDGKVLDDFYDPEGYSLNIMTNVDASEAIILQEKKLYYIDADLNVKVIAEDVEGTGMCYEGGYFYYTKLGESFLRDVFIYDVANESATKVAESNLSNVAISPDGQTIAYFYYLDEKQLYVCRIGEEPKLIKTGVRVSPMTVSNDGKTVFFESIDENDGIYCFDKDRAIKISKEYFSNAFFDRDCKQILFQEPGNVKYYKAGDTSALILFDSSYMDYKVCNVKKQRSGSGYGHYIVDTDCFADVLLISDTYNYYTLKGDVPVLFNIASSEKNMYGIRAAITDNGPVCYYEKEASLYISEYDGSKMVEKKLTAEDEYVSFMAVSDKGDEVWFIKFEDQGIYYSKNGQEPVKVAEGYSGSAFNLHWNPQDGKCYYIKEGKLYSVHDSEDTVVWHNIDMEIKSFGYPHLEESVMCIEDANNNEFVIIGGKVYPYN